MKAWLNTNSTVTSSKFSKCVWPQQLPLYAFIYKGCSHRLKVPTLLLNHENVLHRPIIYSHLAFLNKLFQDCTQALWQSFLIQIRSPLSQQNSMVLLMVHVYQFDKDCFYWLGLLLHEDYCILHLFVYISQDLFLLSNVWGVICLFRPAKKDIKLKQ